MGRTRERERKEWAEGGVEREHMAPLVLEGERERAQLVWRRRDKGELER